MEKEVAEEGIYHADQKEVGKISKLFGEYESRRIEWNEFCNHLRKECADSLDLDESEAGKLKLHALLRMAKRVEDAQEGRI